ncbi:MAG: Imidazole glycerol phosphate synthase subunit HisF [Candidatus Argoarchaeum ethanivorans]|uniref:1-(5-phosphoribosyl)-5-[(5-phosphoribosylamino)methylideneamino] imidazole-4-carboxamide isomerase n=1 Tax=Candidatus Argoarchaeum ethanivorans TaxID=2608793 RepID=A0A811T4S3_9EURY|nr:MAG: Imidazole glycerol phosphate synthase subunit HisF [Candidatus Argoarchaeum ethanivorans]
MFSVIPAVDLKDGRCVQLVQGVPGTEQVSLADPVGAALRWVDEGASILHLVDLDGAIDGVRINTGLIKEIVAVTDVEIQVGGGIRTREDVVDLLDTGVERVIIGTLAVQHPEFVAELASEFGREHITVALDAVNGRVTTHGWKQVTEGTPSDYGKKFESLGAGSILFTNIDTEGLLQGIAPAPTAEFVKAVNIPVIASGGITTIQDLKTMKQIGATGAVVGTALYLGKFRLKDAIESV